ncbi:pilin accessory protein (PilO) [Azospirillum brasilense]|nr:pilin accessory protein (PilO) [Azospirillum brasilense]
MKRFSVLSRALKTRRITAPAVRGEATTILAAPAADYAFGLMWQTPDRNRNLKAECAATAARLKASLTVIAGRQFALAFTAGYRPGRRRCHSAANAVGTSLGKTVFAAFALETGVYVVARVAGLILPDGDRLFDDETEAREFFERYSQTPQWPTAVKVAPANWCVAGAQEIALDNLLARAPATAVLGRPPMRRGILAVIAALLAGAAGVAAFIGLQSVSDPAVTHQRYEALPATLPGFSDSMSSCMDGVMRLREEAHIPGWPLVQWSCDGYEVKGALSRLQNAPRAWGLTLPGLVVPRDDLEKAEAKVHAKAPPSRPLDSRELLSEREAAFRLRITAGVIKAGIKTATAPPRLLGSGEAPQEAPSWRRLSWSITTTVPLEYWTEEIGATVPGTALNSVTRDGNGMVVTGVTYVVP